MTQDVQNMDHFALRQRVTLMVNRYEVRAGGREGQLLALAEQKRMSLREQVTFFADERRTQPLFGFLARQVMDLATTYDITDAFGRPLGWFRKDFGRSLLRSSWLVDVPDQQISGSGTDATNWSRYCAASSTTSTGPSTSTSSPPTAGCS